MPPPYDFTGPNAEAERERMRRDYGIRVDEHGRQYLDRPGQQNRQYISPVARGEAPPADTTGVFRSRPRWNQRTGRWETPIDWTNIANMGVGAGLTAGVGNAIAAGVPTAAGAGTAGGMNQAIPPAISAIGGVGGGTGMIPPAGGAGGGFWRTLGNGARRAVGGGDGGGMNAWQTAALAALAGLPALLAAKNSGMSDEEKAIYAQLQRDIEDQRQDRVPERALRDTQLRRINYQNPLYQAVSQLAMNRLPMNVQQPFGEF